MVLIPGHQEIVADFPETFFGMLVLTDVEGREVNGSVFFREKTVH